MEKAKILVVEDEDSLLRAIMDKMSKSEIEAEGAKSVPEARQKLQNFNPNLIWLDHYLFGEEDGLDLLKSIKKDEKKRNIPVFVVSNTCSNEKYHDYIELGIKKYYVKSSTRLEEIIDEAKRYALAA